MDDDRSHNDKYGWYKIGPVDSGEYFTLPGKTLKYAKQLVQHKNNRHAMSDGKQWVPKQIGYQVRVYRDKDI